jgi:hypothetical protein
MAVRDSRTTVRLQNSGGTSPADDLADLWEVLDTLPAAKPATDLTATTVELVAAKVANDVRPKGGSQARPIDRFVPFAIILGGLVVGLAAGRLTAPDPDAKILERLPVIEHVGLLQELGSVEFLESLAEQMKEGGANPPRWLRLVRDPAGLRVEAQEFEATLAAIRSEMTTDESSRAAIDRRRGHVAALSASDLAALEKSAATFEALAPIDRRELEHLATVLADPTRAPLHEAAKQWHLIVTAMNPAFRRNIIEMPSEDRLEWLTRSAGRYEQRPSNGSRGDERGGDRRPSGPRRENSDPSNRPGSRQPPFQWPPPPLDGDRPTELPPRGPSVRAPRDPRPVPPQATPAETRALPD